MFGYHKVMTFENGYSASIVSHSGSYGGNEGLFEIAIIYDNDIVYDTPIASDVIGFLDFQGVVDTLVQVKNLPCRKPL